MSYRRRFGLHAQERALGPVSFVMVVMACTQGQACKPMMTLPAAYRTEQACLNDRSGIVAALSGPGERLIAECHARGGSGQTSAPVRTRAKAKPVA
jgi:hypothetical protein